MEVLLPELGENIESVEVSAILVMVGETIQKDQPVVEVETEKASAEVPSSHAGIVTKILVREGDTITIGQVILSLGMDDPAAEEEATAGSLTASEPSVPADATTESPGNDRAPAVEQAPWSSQFAQVSPGAPEKKRPLGDPAPAAPSVRRLSRQLGLPIEAVEGTGPRGRISIDDVKAYAKSLIQGSATAVGRSVPGAVALPDFSAYGEVRTERMSKIRHTTALNMARAWNMIPHVTQHDAADITELERLRKRYAGKVEQAGGKLTVTAIIAKVAASALRKFPKFNTSINVEAREVIYKDYVHIGIAVDTGRGLLVPVVKDADRKNIGEIAVSLGELAKKARDKKITPDELAGGSFTISNLGGLGTTYFSPIVNWPEVAILGVGRAALEPKYIDGRFVPRKIMPLSLSYDHRIIDGADAARFLRWIAESLEQPLLLALEG